MNEKNIPQLPPAAAVKVVDGVVSALENLQNELLPPQAVLNNLIVNGVLMSQGISVVAELGVPDLLANEPRHVDELARATGVQADPLYRVLRTMASVGLFSEVGERRFALTKLSACLRSDVPGSLRAWARLAGAPWNFTKWGTLMGPVKTGKTNYETQDGVQFFDFYEKNAEARKLFDEAMTAASNMANFPILAGYDFSGIQTLVDVAGGQGTLLAAILQAYPGMKGTLFDVPNALENAKKGGALAGPELAGRVDMMPGNFFESVPAGRDAYLLKWILHDWNDADCKRILKTCRAAMAPGKKLLISELVVEPGNVAANMMDLVMMGSTGGRERTEAEFRALLSATGFELRRVVPTASPYSVLEAVAV